MKININNRNIQIEKGQSYYHIYDDNFNGRIHTIRTMGLDDAYIENDISVFLLIIQKAGTSRDYVDRWV